MLVLQFKQYSIHQDRKGVLILNSVCKYIHTKQALKKEGRETLLRQKEKRECNKLPFRVEFRNY
uniref:Uncharacterized protein n=1 Tax=Picea glauca TaxID=3330 RepID=A0A101M315_PICGL|nr:hypothetical protein ABT39_MTgene3362 [Picea glauca]